MLEKLIDRNGYLGEGISRAAYRSLIPGYVIKKSISKTRTQERGEKELFEQMTIDEKEVFPIVAIEDGFCMMKEGIPLEDLTEPFEDVPYYSEEIEDEDLMTDFFIRHNLNLKSLPKFYDFVNKYGIKDLHSGNVALLDKSLIIIDAGSNSSNGHKIWGGSEYSRECSEEEEYSTDCSYS